MNKFFLFFFLLVLSLSLTSALSEKDIVFPIAELGNCDSMDSCKVYCDNAENIDACLSFGEKYGLMSKEEAEDARKVLPLLKSGQTPGGCTSKGQCQAYCEKEENLNECISFAEKAGFISSEEAEMVRKTRGKGPGDCKGREQCESYCRSEEHMMECVEFAHQHGFIDEKEYEKIKKFGGRGPGACRGERECRAYCENPANKEECIEFAHQTGELSEEDYKRYQQKGPGGCSSREECDTYCKGNPSECSGYGSENDRPDYEMPEPGYESNYDERQYREGQPSEQYVPPEGFTGEREGESTDSYAPDSSTEERTESEVTETESSSKISSSSGESSEEESSGVTGAAIAEGESNSFVKRVVDFLYSLVK